MGISSAANEAVDPIACPGTARAGSGADSGRAAIRHVRRIDSFFAQLKARGGSRRDRCAGGWSLSVDPAWPPTGYRLRRGDADRRRGLDHGIGVRRGGLGSRPAAFALYPFGHHVQLHARVPGPHRAPQPRLGLPRRRSKQLLRRPNRSGRAGIGAARHHTLLGDPGSGGAAHPETAPPTLNLGSVLKVKVEARGSHFKVWVQNQIVDEWQDDQLKTGAVGFFKERGALGKIGSLAISLPEGGPSR